MAAESVVSTVVGQLGNLLKQEVNFLSGVSGQVEQMQRELKLMQSYLEDADKRQDENKTLQAWVSEIREAAYDAQAVIETHFLKVASRRRGGIQNTFKRYACILGEAMEIHKVGSEIKAITTRMSNLRSSLQGYGIMPKSEGECGREAEGSSSTHGTAGKLRRTYSHVEEYTVGWDRDVEILVGQLVNEQKHCGVVSICGMGGLGKTTLAQKVYHHKDIKHHFDGFAWASISQQFQPKDVWEGIVLKLSSTEDRSRIRDLREEELVRKLREVQLNKKFLVILDDIWTTEAWDRLRPAFPLVGNTGSKILLTSRNKDVALYADPRGFLHEPLCLNEEESWELLLTKVFPEKNDPEIREAAYDAEAVIETYFLKVASRRRGGIQNAFKRYACILGEAKEIHKVGSEIEAIKTRISDLRSSLQNYGIVPQSDGEGSSSTLIRARQNLRRVYSHIVEEYTVGLDRAVKDLVALLVNEEKPCGVVSICGMGGLGKTTLAKKIYHHSDIRPHFNGFAWVSVSRQFQPRNIWEGILIGLISPSQEQRQEIKGLSDEELAKRLYEVQQHKKFLVILDDVWTTEAWNRLCPAFPLVENTGSKILLTTRNKTVAEHVDPRGFLHESLYLNEEESWELLRTKAFPKKDDPDFKIDTEKEKLGKEMVRRCKGLPLAIVVLGGILARKNALNDWNMVLENIKLYLRRGEGRDQQHSGVSEVLALSYHELPYKIKPCFLHLGQFPEDRSIPAKKLYKLWVAEGIVSPSQYEVEEEESLEDIAKCYLDELIQRCMVQVWKKGLTGTVKTCRLHDLMRDFSLLKAKEENFLKNVPLSEQKEQVDSLSSMATTTNSTNRVRRLAIHLSIESLEFFPQQIITPYVQSLLFFGPYGIEISQKMISKFSDFKLLKVLDFDSCKISGKLPRAIGKLVHLRYLSLDCVEITSISSSIGNLRFL